MKSKERPRSQIFRPDKNRTKRLTCPRPGCIGKKAFILQGKDGMNFRCTKCGYKFT